MESINHIFKGYGKIDNPTQYPNPDNRRRRNIIAASSAIFLTLIVAGMIGALVHESATESEGEEGQGRLSSNADESLKATCSVTQHPDSCFTSLTSSLNDLGRPDPVHFYNLSLQYCLRDLENISSLPRNLVPELGDPRTESALKDCASLFVDSLSQLNQTAELMSVGPGEKVFTEMRISDMKTWISAAMTDLETCLDGLNEMGSTAVNEVGVRVQKSQEYMSNTLAILSNLPNLAAKFGLPLP